MPYYIKDPKRDHNFDNHPHATWPKALFRPAMRRAVARDWSFPRPAERGEKGGGEMWFSVIGAWCSYELGLSSSAHQLLDRFFDLSIGLFGRKACLNKILSTRVEDRDLSSLSISASSCSACTIILQMQAGLSKPTIHILVYTHRPQSSSFWGLPYRILNIKPPKGTTLGPMGSGASRVIVSSCNGTQPRQCPRRRQARDLGFRI